jgi:hypothetical protein
MMKAEISITRQAPMRVHDGGRQICHQLSTS